MFIRRRKRNPDLFDGARPGDVVWYVDRHGGEHRGKVVFAMQPSHLTLNVGGAHGRPVVVTRDQVSNLIRTKDRHGGGHFDPDLKKWGGPGRSSSRSNPRRIPASLDVPARSLRKIFEPYLQAGKTSGRFIAFVGYVVGAHWTSPELAEVTVTADDIVLGRVKGDVGFNEILGPANGDEGLFTNWRKFLRHCGLDADARRVAMRLFNDAVSKHGSRAWASD